MTTNYTGPLKPLLEGLDVPDWAKYATLDSDGLLGFWSSRPVIKDRWGFGLRASWFGEVWTCRRVQSEIPWRDSLTRIDYERN